MLEADLITFGPGSFLSSIVPFVLYQGLLPVLRSNPNAVKVLILNSTTQSGQTDGWSPYEHVNFLLDTAQDRVIDVVIADSLKPTLEALQRLHSLGREYLDVTSEEVSRIESLGVKVWLAPLVDRSAVAKQEWDKDDAVVYHHPNRLALELLSICKALKVGSNPEKATVLN